MRTSVRQDDPGYKNWMDMGGFERRWEILLNGKPLDLCITADEEQGYALCFVPNKDGRPYLNQSRRKVETIEFYGKIEIRYRNKKMIEVGR